MRNRVLAIDDFSDHLELIASILKKGLPDSETLTARGGREGIHLARERAPDVILLDAHMPGLDGFETCRRLKNDPDTRAIPVLMMSAVFTQAMHRAQGLDYGADVYLSKPYDKEELVSQVKALLRIKENEDKLRRHEERLEGELALRVSELKESETRLRKLSEHTESVREEERGRVAREIHDQLGQSLSALRMEISRLRTCVLDDARSNDDVEGLFQDMQEMVDRIIGDVRRLAWELRPPMLDDLGLAAAIGWHTHEFEKHSGIRCCVVLSPDDLQASEPAATHLFRIVQELLTNAARHSGASRISVELIVQDEQGVLTVNDNGCGIKPESVADSRSLGLIGLRERVEILNGNVAFDGTPGQGTRVVVRVPLPGRVSDYGK